MVGSKIRPTAHRANFTVTFVEKTRQTAFMDFFLPSIAFIEGLGGPEMVLIFVIVLVLFGGEKLPDFARGLGKSIREFKKAASGVEEEFKRALEEDAQKKSIPPPSPTTFPAYPPTSTPPALEAPPPVDAVTTPPAAPPVSE